MERKQPKCVEIGPGPCLACADAQATIAALEETILKMGENAAVVAKDAMAAKEQVAALQAERDEYKTMYACLTGETYDNPIADLQSQLTQRTAELERVRGELGKMQAKHPEDSCYGALPQLREQNRVLRQFASTAVERWRAQTNVKEGISFRMAMKALESALTAASQPTKPQGRMHACDIPGCVSCGNPEDATSQEGQANG